MQHALDENPTAATSVIWGDLMRVLSFADSPHWSSVHLNGHRARRR
jgi:hypothetical protein